MAAAEAARAARIVPGPAEALDEEDVDAVAMLQPALDLGATLTPALVKTAAIVLREPLPGAEVHYPALSCASAGQYSLRPNCFAFAGALGSTAACVCVGDCSTGGSVHGTPGLRLSHTLHLPAPWLRLAAATDVCCRAQGRCLACWICWPSCHSPCKYG